MPIYEPHLRIYLTNWLSIHQWVMYFYSVYSVFFFFFSFFLNCILFVSILHCYFKSAKKNANLLQENAEYFDYVLFISTRKIMSMFKA